MRKAWKVRLQLLFVELVPEAEVALRSASVNDRENHASARPDYDLDVWLCPL
jgi:hypothetical protein